MSERRDFIKRAKQQLEDWDYQLDRFEHRVEDLAREAQDKARALLRDAREQRSKLKDKLESVESHSEAAWEDIKDGAEIAWDGLKTAYYAAKAEFEKDDKD